MGTTEMNTTEMNPEFARAVRAELIAIGTKSSRLQRQQRRTRSLALTIGALVLAGATTGAAVIVNSFPGATTVTPLGQIVTATHTGTASLDLGPAPAKAAAVVIDLTCLSSEGTVSVLTNPQTEGLSEQPGGLKGDCALVRKPLHIDDGLLPASGTTSITITASPGTAWKATAQYASSSTTPWGVNAQGQTYGVPNVHGLPDLEPAQATNGKQGYIVTEELLAMDHDGYINVYESDGTTVVGKFPFGIVPNIVDGSFSAATDAPTDGASK
jgi:hypothetical protein